MGTTLNQSKQNFRAIGLVNELNLEKEDCEIKVKDGDDETTAKGERIRGNVVVRIGDGVKRFDVFCNSLTSKGEESKQWKNALAMLDLNPEIGGKSDVEPSLVLVTGRVNENRYYNTNTKDASVGLRWNASRISTSRVSEDDAQGCTLNGNFYIKSIKPETKDDEETGRLNVALVGVEYGASPFIVNAIVEEDLAEGFEDMYEVGQTANFSIDVAFEHVGAKTTKKAFGGEGKIKSSGFDREYLVIVGGDEPIEESDMEDEDGNPVDNGWIDPKAMKIALKERDTKIAEIKENGGDSGRGSGSKMQQAKAKAKKSIGTKKSVPEPYVDDDDDDEDDPF